MPEQDPTKEAPAPDGGDDRPAAVAAETTPETDVAPPAPAAAPRRSGPWLPLAGGALAAALGFGIAQFDAFGLRAPAYDDTALKAGLAAAEERAATLEADLARLSAATDADRTTTEAALSASTEPLMGLPDRIAALEEQAARLEQALADAATASPDGAVTPAALAALSSAVEALKTQIAALQSSPVDPESIRALAREELAAWEAAAAARLEADRATAEAAAARATAIGTLQQALITGAPYAQALAVLPEGEVPEIVSAHAETGLPTLASLTESFPEAARAALEAALRAQSGGGLAEGFWSFLRIQTGARSLTPQDGDDADAVLSRAEAALRAGDLAAALAELVALPPEAQTALAPWVAEAEDHRAAAAAIAALAAPAP